MDNGSDTELPACRPDLACRARSFSLPGAPQWVQQFRGVVATLIPAPLLPNFWTHGKLGSPLFITLF